MSNFSDDAEHQGYQLFRPLLPPEQNPPISMDTCLTTVLEKDSWLAAILAARVGSELINELELNGIKWAVRRNMEQFQLHDLDIAPGPAAFVRHPDEALLLYKHCLAQANSDLGVAELAFYCKFCHSWLRTCEERNGHLYYHSYQQADLHYNCTNCIEYLLPLSEETCRPSDCKVPKYKLRKFATLSSIIATMESIGSFAICANCKAWCLSSKYVAFHKVHPHFCHEHLFRLRHEAYGTSGHNGLRLTLLADCHGHLPMAGLVNHYPHKQRFKLVVWHTMRAMAIAKFRKLLHVASLNSSIMKFALILARTDSNEEAIRKAVLICSLLLPFLINDTGTNATSQLLLRSTVVLRLQRLLRKYPWMVAL